MDNKKTAITASILALLLTSCSSMPDWMGSADKDIDTSGKRISVLKLGTTIEPDFAMKDVPIVVPSSSPNALWAKSSGDRPLVPENVRAPKVFKDFESVSVGHEASKGQHFTATPIIANGKIYTIDARGQISAFDAEKINKKLWQYQADLPDKKGNFSNAGILFHLGKIYVSTDSNRVLAIDAETGNLLWTRNINSIARSAPAAEGNVILVNTVDNKIYAIDANDGGILWVHSGSEEEMSMVGTAAPVVSNGIVYAPYSSGELYALKLEDGSEIWSDSLAVASGNNNASYLFADIDASPIVAGGKIYAISDDGVLIAAEAGTGKRLWEHGVSGNKTPWFASGFLYIINDKNEIISIDAATGGVKWVKKLPSYKNEEKKSDPISWSGPVLAGDVLLVVGSNGQLLSISPQTGDVVTTTKVPKNIYVSPIVANDHVYLLNDDAKLIELGGNL
jgi:outer membrane protein assembly factor BamB